MGYAIRFVRPEAGRTLDETLEDSFSRLSIGSPNLRLSPEQRTGWDQIVRRVTAELGSATSEEFRSDLVLRYQGPSGYMQLNYRGDWAELDIEYFYSGRLPLPGILAEAYTIATIVEQETGLAGFDVEAAQWVAGADLALAAVKLAEATQRVRESKIRRGELAG